MKIYNKKSFVTGIFMVALATVNLIADVANRSVDRNGIILACALYLLGFESIARSLSKNLAIQDKLEELDERNQFVAYKSKSKAFSLSQVISFSLMIALLVIGKVSGNESFIFMGVGLAFAYSISLMTEFFTYLYYEEKD